MCGIIGVLRSPEADLREVELARLIEQLEVACGSIPGLVASVQQLEELEQVAQFVETAVSELAGSSGVAALAASDTQRRELIDLAGRLLARVAELEGVLDRSEASPGVDAESVNQALVAVKDVTWQLRWDRLETASHALELHPGIRHRAGAAALLSVQQALQSLDRMEVRGRDSAGLHLLVWGHGLDAAEVQLAVSERSDPLLRRRTLRRLGPDLLGLTYKCAAEIGELGDNVRDLRQQIVEDATLRAALGSESVRLAVLGHTRWASVGIISEPNAHPLDERQVDSEPEQSSLGPASFAVLNGDVDNYADLAITNELKIDPAITTDAKVIPALWSRAMTGDAAQQPVEAFRRTVSQFEGSVAIAAVQAEDPGQLLLALRGSGQALYVGLGDDAFIVASELYGVVEETDRYLRLDGETPGNPANPSASRGQVVALSVGRAGQIEGLQRVAYDGTVLPIGDDDLQRTEITTRDVDRRDAPHYLLKELEEAPDSWRKTLRGRLLPGAEGPRVQLPDSSLPPEVVGRIRDRAVQHILVIGQGTAAVAGQAVAQAIEQRLARQDVRVQALPATELSGFRMRDRMHDTLVVAISQSGTTTDTNRTVDLVRSRGAAVIAIVNRRNSDLTDKADGVLYTSDGRDLEMSVASTKAFYSQVAAGFLLAFALRDAWVGGLSEDGASSLGDQDRQLLDAMLNLPDALRRLLAQRTQIGQRTASLVLPKRYWAVVGNGFNRVAAEEVRIKLSELCYKSIACDATEDKKHIDLSCEPMILVSAAGLTGSTADDVAKEVAIYRAHKATPIVIATQGEQRFAAASALIEVPSIHPQLDFVLAAMAGHLFGYEAAKAIDEQAQPMRRIRTELESMVDRIGSASHAAPRTAAPPAVGDLLREIAPRIHEDAHTILGQISTGQYNGHLEASSATRLATCLQAALGEIPLDSFARISNSAGTPGAVLDELHDILGPAIDELTRPIDAIKHQAKTVTVGISRTDEAFLTVPLVRAVLDSGVARDRLTFDALRTLATLDPLIARVLGHTRYRLDGEPGSSSTTIRVVAEDGLSRGLPSRTEAQPQLRGTKRSVAREGKVLVARGSSDGRLFVLVPEREAGRTVGLVLTHIELVAASDSSVLRGALSVYRQRYSRLRDAVMETEPSFREDLLGELSPEQLLVEPIPALAQHWRQHGAPGSA